MINKRDVAAEVQEILKKLCFYRGEVTGVWDDSTERAFREWAGYENFENKIRDDDKIWGSVYRFLKELANR
nr:putative peptidoglycan binding domain-containing protein [Pyrobaculum islandicum]